MKNELFLKDEWTQEEYLKSKEILKKDGIDVILVDTILKPLDNAHTITYNPFELLKYPKEKSVFVFYCDTGKTTKERLDFYKSKFTGYKCVSLRGGKGYWRPFFQLLNKSENK